MSLHFEFRVVISVTISHVNDDRFVFLTILFVCLSIVVSTSYCVMFCVIFLRRVYPMLPVSLDCPFWIAPSVFSNVHLL